MWEKLTAQQKDAIKAGFILAFVLLGGVGAYWWKFTTPDIAAAEKTVATLDTEIKDLNGQLREMNEAASNLEQLKEKQQLLAEVAAKLPSTVAPQEFYRALEEILKITRMSYSELAQLPLLERAVYTEIPYQIVGNGRYHDFGQFLNLVEENPNRLMRIKTFVIENDDARPSVHPLKVQLATFKFNTKG
jgi:Tfp pilus assembly protein PilO